MTYKQHISWKLFGRDDCHFFFWATYKTDFFSNATLIVVYANWAFAAIKGIGWGWAGVKWLYIIVFYFLLRIINFLILLYAE
uniref:Uncharacterized protein n=1 Tax=Zea mays TaxID=4577 RepID=A0A804U6X1_MAIZE